MIHEHMVVYLDTKKTICTWAPIAINWDRQRERNPWHVNASIAITLKQIQFQNKGTISQSGLHKS